jgi:hypothetical protein
MSSQLFTQIGINNETICEVNFSETTRTFSIYWIRREFKGMIDITYFDCSITVKDWLKSLVLISGHDKISFGDVLIKKKKDIDFKHYGELNCLNVPWCAFHNSDPFATFEINLATS